MSRWRHLAQGLALCSCSCAPNPNPIPGQELASRNLAPDLVALEAELLAAHRATLDFHRTGDAQGMAAAASDPSFSVSRGRVDTVTRAEVEARFEGYFSAATFSRYEDVEEPIARVSKDGSLGWVIARVRVEGRYRHDDGAREPLDTTWGWIELYEREGEAWRRVGTVSDHDEGPEGLAGALGSPGSAELELLEAAQTALGGREALVAIQNLETIATVTSPRGPLTTQVIAAADGRVRFEQRSDAGVRVITALAEGVWLSDGEAAIPGGTADRAFAYGHALHLALMSPTRLYNGAKVAGEARLGGRPARVIELVDVLGNPVRIYYDADTALPLGLELVEPESTPPEPILVEVDDWRPYGTILAFHHAIFRHRGAEYVYDYGAIRFNAADPSRLVAPVTPP